MNNKAHALSRVNMTGGTIPHNDNDEIQVSHLYYVDVVLDRNNSTDAGDFLYVR